MRQRKQKIQVKCDKLTLVAYAVIYIYKLFEGEVIVGPFSNKIIKMTHSNNPL